MEQPIIETERFYIRELRLEDEEGMFEMDSDPLVHRYIRKQPVQTLEEERDVIAFVRQQYIDNGIGRWAIIEKQTNEFIGWTGFKLMRETVNGQTDYYDFGYRLKQSVWGKGIATETGRAALRYGVDKMNLWPVFAMTDVNNAASRHCLEKLGFVFRKIFLYSGPSQWRTPEDISATWYELPEDFR
jgi:[ribosomal protein S5]-alanine N-acetyltransferase